MLADESRDLLVSHVVFRLDFFAGVPFCQFWGGIVLDEIVVNASLGEAFLIPNCKDIYVLRFGNAVDGRFLDLVLLNNLINGVEKDWVLVAWVLQRGGLPGIVLQMHPSQSSVSATVR